MANRSLAGGARAGARQAIAVASPLALSVVAPAVSLVIALVLSLALPACRRNEPAPSAAPPALPSGAHPEPFVHPPIPSEPVASPQARPECSYAALVPVAARIREAQTLGTRALVPAKKKKKKDGLPRCGTPAQAELEHRVKGELADRVRICVGQDGPLDPEWNLLEAALASLGNCIDCTRMSEGREVDCQRTAARVTQAEADAAKAKSDDLKRELAPR
jgi:hypothetical protein